MIWGISMGEKRSSFSGKIGFVLAAAGSAVGLGNIWRFPYLAAKYGGGIFLLVYVLLALTFGFALMVTEIAIGRKTQLSAVEAFSKLNKKFAFIGYIAALVPIIILPYYSVIGGWVMKYLSGFALNNASTMAGENYFNSYIAKTGEPVFWFFVFMAITALVVIFGVEKGIEKVSKVMMPLLVILIVFICVYTICTMDGAWAGVLYYITPDFSKFSMMTVVAALGQLFYSMSLAMGIMLTYGSYMKKEISIEKSVHQIEWFDTGIAFLAGLMIIPAVFASSGGNESALRQGPGLMFDTLPKIFDKMPGGSIVGAVFFVMVLFAALTSSISLMETIVSIFSDKLKIKRTLSCVIVFVICILLGIPSSLGYSAWKTVTIMGFPVLDFFDFISNNIIMPIVALLTCFFVGYILTPKSVIEELEQNGNKFTMKKAYSVIVRFVAPVCIVVILVSSVLDVLGIIKI